MSADTMSEALDDVARPLETVWERILARFMSDLSEEHWAAGWLDGTEVALWEATLGTRAEWGMRSFDATDLEDLKWLKTKAGIWCIRWDLVVPLDVWSDHYKAWRLTKKEDR